MFYRCAESGKRRERHVSGRIRSLACGVGLLGAALASGANDVATSPSEPARLSAAALLLGVASAGQSIVAVGDRGHVLVSDDAGRTWLQVGSPTQVLLTAVCFSDAHRGIAVGHDEVILVSGDAGRTWTRTHSAPEAQQPLLDVWCGAEGRAIAVGAYGGYFVSDDYGAHWSERQLEATNAKPVSDEAGGGVHLNAIAADVSSRLFVAAESGHLYRSDDRGQTWQELSSPYHGSLFGVLPVSGDVVLAFGLRGNLFRSEDAGATWRTVATGTEALLDGAALLDDGGVVIVGLAGVVLQSRDGGRTFSLVSQADRKGLAAVREVAKGVLVTVGEAGARLVSEPKQ